MIVLGLEVLTSIYGMLIYFDDLLPVACDCDQDGSQDLTCNRESGQCNCHDGITNRTCNSCVNEGFWGPKDGQCRNCTCVPDNTIECVQVSLCHCVSTMLGTICLTIICSQTSITVILDVVGSPGYPDRFFPFCIWVGGKGKVVWVQD